MVDKLKDAEDRFLEAVFESPPIADDGFSRRVVAKIRRRMWVRRLTLPIAIVIGGAIAIKPASQLVTAAAKVLTVVPEEVLEMPTSWMPQMESVAYGASFTQMVILGAMLLTAGILGTRMLVD